MNNSKRKLATTAIAVVAAACLSGVAAAQDATTGSSSNAGGGASTYGTGATRAAAPEERHFDYGWLGLAGLIGLLKKPQQVVTHETTRVASPAAR